MACYVWPIILSFMQITNAVPSTFHSERGIITLLPDKNHQHHLADIIPSSQLTKGV